MAVAALGLSACTGEKLVPDNGNADGKFVTVHFGAEASIEGATKATLTTKDELTFKSAWVDGDVLSVKYSNDNGTAGATTSGVVSATWTTDHFEATLQKYNGTWDYNVVYPAPDAEGAVDFGSARTQKGNAYNSKYDLMKGGAIETGADAGMTADGKNIVFNMTRQTAIAYFHLTSTLDEEVVSAKLSVEGGNIASSLVMLLDHTDGFDLSTADLNEITITYDAGTAPKASDFQLWYNVLPTKYTKMTLTVETANHTLTISRAKADNYAAGKLYKVVKNIPADKWVKKVTANDGSLERPYTAAEAIAAIDANTGLTGKYVKGIVKATPSFDARYSSLTYDIESGAKTLNIYSGKDLGNAGFVGAEDLKAGDEVVVLGDLQIYKGKYQVDKNNYLISINGETQIYRGLAVSGQKTAFTVGDAFEFGGKALQVWRGKEDVDVTASATFSGYDMATEGKQTVTVTVGGESVTYEITVNPAGTVLEKSETIILANGKFVAGENPTITWSGTSCSFVQTKGTSTSKVANYIDKPRWYKSHVISFKANTGYKITKVVVTCTNNSYATELKNSTYSPAETTSATASGTEVTITTAGDFAITMGAQSRISSVVVYYTD